MIGSKLIFRYQVTILFAGDSDVDGSYLSPKKEVSSNEKSCFNCLPKWIQRERAIFYNL